MLKYVLYAVPALLAGTSIPASAAVVVLASNVDLSSRPFTLNVGGGSSFTFSYSPSSSFDFDPVAFQTGGTAAATAFGGFLGIPLVPSTFFTRDEVEIGASTFPGFDVFPVATKVPYSLGDGDLGLRYTIGSDNYYGYARFGGSLLQTIAFETTANASILTGATAAVPEPASWAMMIGGFAIMGTAMRRRQLAFRFA